MQTVGWLDIFKRKTKGCTRDEDPLVQARPTNRSVVFEWMESKIYLLSLKVETVETNDTRNYIKAGLGRNKLCESWLANKLKNQYLHFSMSFLN